MRLLTFWIYIVLGVVFALFLMMKHSTHISGYQAGNMYVNSLTHEQYDIVQRRPIPIRATTKMRFGPVYVLGAVGRNTTNHTVWDVVNLYGSVEKSFMKTFSNTVMCCMVYKNQQGQKSTDVVQRDVFKSKVYNFTHPTEEERTAETVNWFHVACPNVQHLNGGLPFAAGLSSKDTGCDKENKDNYIKIEYPFQEPGFKIAIGTQIAYQNINAELIIEWMETYKYLQVDKVVSFYHRNINKDALKVLTYYHNTGFVDLFEIALPAEEAFPRQFEHGSGQLFNDLRLSVSDTLERMSGYTYFGIIDFDEFLIPVKHKTIKEMLMELQNTYTNAAGFVFKTQYFFLTWGMSNYNSDLIIGQYVNRTAQPPVRGDRKKALYMPSRVSHSGVRTHGFIPAGNFKGNHVSDKIGYLRHFRSCRNITDDACMTPPSDRATDKTVVEWSKLIESNVLLAREKIFGTDHQ